MISGEYFGLATEHAPRDDPNLPSSFYCHTQEMIEYFLRRPIRRSRLRFYRRSSVPRRLFCRVAFAPSLSRRRRRLHRRQSRPHHRVTIRDNVVILFRVVINDDDDASLSCDGKDRLCPTTTKTSFFTPEKEEKEEASSWSTSKRRSFRSPSFFFVCDDWYTNDTNTSHTFVAPSNPSLFCEEPLRICHTQRHHPKTLYTNKTLKKREKKKCARHISFLR